MMIVDAHLDLAYNVGRGRDVRQPAAMQPVVDNEIATVGLPDLLAGRIQLICATVFAPPAREGRRGYTTAEEAWTIAQTQLDWYDQQVNAGLMEQVRTRSDLPEASMGAVGQDHPSRPLKFILLLEGADPVRRPEDVDAFFNRGVRIIGLAWRKGRMAGGTNHPGPLTDEGRQVVRAMDRLGMIHDASHLAEESFWQLLDLTAGPILASHSNCRAIVPTDRQMSDEMLKALIARGGVVGINYYDEFLQAPEVFKKRRCTLKEDVLPHILRICDLAGSASHVAIGTDADGGLGRQDMPVETPTIAYLDSLAGALAGAGFSDEQIRGIMGTNWLRFFSRALPR